MSSSWIACCALDLGFAQITFLKRKSILPNVMQTDEHPDIYNASTYV